MMTWMYPGPSAVLLHWRIKDGRERNGQSCHANLGYSGELSKSAARALRARWGTTERRSERCARLAGTSGCKSPAVRIQECHLTSVATSPKLPASRRAHCAKLLTDELPRRRLADRI